eukprot:5819442-Karenia_brevis.AAC.2
MIIAMIIVIIMIMIIITVIIIIVIIVIVVFCKRGSTDSLLPRSSSEDTDGEQGDTGGLVEIIEAQEFSEVEGCI